MSEQQMSVRPIGLPDGRRVTIVEAGYLGRERIEPPGGPEHAFWRSKWRHRIEVYTSRTGRSVRVWIDGTEVPCPPVSQEDPQ